MNPALDRLHPYPFQRLQALLDGLSPPADRRLLALHIGEPQHPAPAAVTDALARHLDDLGRYPTTRGEPTLRETIAVWLTRRFNLGEGKVDPERQVLPVNGTREALFALAQAVIDPRPADATVVLPNPFYQIYEGAALLAGAVPEYVPTDPDTGLMQWEQVPAAVWDRCQLLYLCSPGNPSGAVESLERLRALLDLADRHDFVIAADECYSEIYPDESRPPPGLLQACQTAGRTDFARCVVFHSLSKRSNLPGLRSGFVAGDAGVLARFLQYRTYQGGAMGLPVQHASQVAWSDETHVVANRAAYREKFDRVLTILGDRPGLQQPDAGFYLWPRLSVDDTDFARTLYAEEGLTVLPGRFLGRESAGHHPGRQRVRLALVPPLDDCIEAAHRLCRVWDRLA